MEPRRSISNSAVKHCGGDNTFRVTGREDSLVPRGLMHLLLIEGKKLKKQKPFRKGEGWGTPLPKALLCSANPSVRAPNYPEACQISTMKTNTNLIQARTHASKQ
jgi:hypothetical protein